MTDSALDARARQLWHDLIEKPPAITENDITIHGFGSYELLRDALKAERRLALEAAKAKIVMGTIGLDSVDMKEVQSALDALIAESS